MKTSPFDAAPAAEPVYDTWQFLKDAATWRVAPGPAHTGLPGERINAWYADVLSGSLEAFGGLARVRRFELSPVASPDSEESRPDGIRAVDFHGRLLDRIRGAESALAAVRIWLDLHVWARTVESPGAARHLWITPPETTLYLLGGPDDAEPGASFQVNHSLFCFRHPGWGVHNRELFEKNEPLLSQTLREWERRFGPIEVEGRLLGYGLYEHGFVAPSDAEGGGGVDLLESQ